MWKVWWFAYVPPKQAKEVQQTERKGNIFKEKRIIEGCGFFSHEDKTFVSHLTFTLHRWVLFWNSFTLGATFIGIQSQNATKCEKGTPREIRKLRTHTCTNMHSELSAADFCTIGPTSIRESFSSRTVPRRFLWSLGVIPTIQFPTRW